MAKTPQTFLGRVAGFVGSYWLAVVLLVNLFLLTWLGTLDQVGKGVHRVQVEYFESWWVQTRMPLTPTLWIPLVLPGGLLTMGLLTVGLLVGGVNRLLPSPRQKVGVAVYAALLWLLLRILPNEYQWERLLVIGLVAGASLVALLYALKTRRRIVGVLVVHAGIVLMMVGGVVEWSQKQYGSLVLQEGQSARHYVDHGLREVAIWAAGSDVGVEEFIVPETDFDDLEGDARRTFQSAELPFDIVLSRYMEHAGVRSAAGVGIPTAPVIEGLFLESLPPTDEPESDRRGVYVKVLTEGGLSMQETFLTGRSVKPFSFEAAGRTWSMMLRKKMYDLPFGVRLVDFVKDDHPGTGMARSFSSDIVRIEPDGAEVPVHIRMNEPMRVDGYIVYQSGWGPQNGEPVAPYSVFAISDNPSDRIPWISVSIIALGLLWTFLDRLVVFMVRQRKRTLAEGAATKERPEELEVAA